MNEFPEIGSYKGDDKDAVENQFNLIITHFSKYNTSAREIFYKKTYQN